MAVRSSHRTIRTHCSSCSLNCGFEIEVNARGEILGRRRWRTAPLAGGELCPIGEQNWQQVDRPDRLTKPLVRDNGRLEVADWPEALDRAAAGLERVRQRHGSDATAVLADASITNEKAYLLAKFARLALRTRHLDHVDRDGLGPARQAYREAFGDERSTVALSEVSRADVIVVAGGDLATTHPVALPGAVAKARRRGAEVITIGSAGPNDAPVGRGSLDLRTVDGAVGPLLLGLLALIERRGSIAPASMAGPETGIEAALVDARPWSSDRVTEATGVDGTSFELAAELLAGAKRAIYLITPGPTPDRSLSAAGTTALINLALACGHVGGGRGGVAVMTGERNGSGVGVWGLGHRGLPGGRSIDDPYHRAVLSRRWGFDGGQIPPAGAPHTDLAAMVADGRLRGLLSWGGEVPAGLDHAVVVDAAPTESALENAAVILPGTVLGEEEGTVTTVEGRIVRCDQAVPPAVRYSEIDIVRNLARRLDCRQHFDFVRGREVWEEMRRVSVGGPADHFGVTWERARDGIFWPCPDESDPGLPPADGRRSTAPDARPRFRPIADARSRRVDDGADRGGRSDGVGPVDGTRPERPGVRPTLGMAMTTG